MIGYLSEDQIEEVLRENVYGHLGCNDGYDTFVYPINYLYDGKFITCHSQPGAKVRIMRKNNRVCLQVDVVNSFTNWKTVMVQGEYQELEDEWERYYAIKAFVDRMLHLKISETSLRQDTVETQRSLYMHRNNRSAIYRIVIDQKSGRYETE